MTKGKAVNMNKELTYRNYRNQKTYENILREYFSDVGWLRATHPHFWNCCCPYILVYVVASNTSPFQQPSLRHAVRSPHTHATCKIFSFNFGLSEKYFTQIFFLRNFTRRKKSKLRYLLQGFQIKREVPSS